MIKYITFEDGDISNLESLCNDLMAFQAEHATIKKEVMASMNYQNRLVPDYNNASRRFITVAYNEDVPVGFAFATVSEVTEAAMTMKPVWAEDLSGLGFYPDDYAVPKMIGTYKLLYVNPNYRGLNIGATISKHILTWLKSHEDVEDLWVFVANGNEKVGKLYEKLGYSHSHTVFNGFIEAYVQKK